MSDFVIYCQSVRQAVQISSAIVRDSQLVNPSSMSAFSAELPVKHLKYRQLLRILKNSNTMSEKNQDLVYDLNDIRDISIMNDESLRVAIRTRVNNESSSMRIRIVSNDDFDTHLSHR